MQTQTHGGNSQVKTVHRERSAQRTTPLIRRDSDTVHPPRQRQRSSAATATPLIRRDSDTVHPPRQRQRSFAAFNSDVISPAENPHTVSIFVLSDQKNPN